MLVYHPYNDPYHCAFRILRLLLAIAGERCEVDRLRILDFYLLFPEQLNSVRFPRDAQRYKRKAAGKHSYEQLGDPYKVLIQLEPYQRAALGCLAACALIDGQELQNGWAVRTTDDIPQALRETIQHANDQQHDLVGLLAGPFFDLEFYGEQGLKARTKLMEYRYDG